VSGDTYRDGKVHVCESMCSTCIFRKGNKMQLRPGRVRQMVDDCKRHETAIVCHSTYDGEHAICYGFWKRWRNDIVPLRLAQLMGIVVYLKPRERHG